MPILYLSKDVLEEIKRRASQRSMTPNKYLHRLFKISMVDGKTKYDFSIMKLGETLEISQEAESFYGVDKAVQRHNEQFPEMKWSAEYASGFARITRVR